MSREWLDNDKSLLASKVTETLSIHVFNLGSTVSIRTERNDGTPFSQSPTYSQFDKDMLPTIVALLIDAGFPPEWSM